uniref:C2H2-type domain-containing protein n=1 Tax=Timema genevievae TaxID=629358 RepID=A0A7R9K550_TIMGE|nr:unnamed protein product [Timema genevievae]
MEQPSDLQEKTTDITISPVIATQTGQENIKADLTDLSCFYLNLSHADVEHELKTAVKNGMELNIMAENCVGQSCDREQHELSANIPLGGSSSNNTGTPESYRTLKCPNCRLLFRYPKRLETANSLHNGKLGGMSAAVPPKRQCPTCPFCQLNINGNRKKLLRPWKENPLPLSKTQGMKCESCGLEFFNRNFLQSHREKHHMKIQDHFPKMEGFKCAICKVNFNDRQHLKLHQEFYHEIQNKLSQKCPECELEFTKCDALQSHWEYYHNQVENEEGFSFVSKKQISCHTCKAQFTKHELLEAHLRSSRCKNHHLKRKMESTLKSEYIGQDNQLVQSSSYHKPKYTITAPLLIFTPTQNIYQQTPIKLPAVCGTCHQQFQSYEDLVLHSDLYHKTEDKAGTVLALTSGLSCEMCGKTFQDGALLAQHKDTHVGIMKCKCFDCNMECPSSAELAAHVALCHSKDY